MTARRIVNLAESVRRRLLDMSVERGESFDLLLTRYGLERLLYRLGRSEHADSFVLKGAMLFWVWEESAHRPTRDLDLLGLGDSSPVRLAHVFRTLCERAEDPDGLTLDANSVRVEEIRETQEYGGQRVRIEARLGSARIPLQIDVGFGDAVTPRPQEIDYPTLLDFPAPRVSAYPVESVVAEKLQALVALGIVNSRMKDFYDLYVIAERFSLEGETLVDAIRATFERRQTAIPSSLPVGLTEGFASLPEKATLWTAFCRRTGLSEAVGDFPAILEKLRAFLSPPIRAATGKEDFLLRWKPGERWT